MNITLKRLLVVFSVSLNIGFAAFLILSQFDASKKEGRPHLNIAYQALAQTKVSPPVREEARRAIAEFDTRISALHREISASRLGFVRFFAAPDPLPLKQLESMREKHQQMLHERTRLLHRHFLNLRRILGPADAQIFFTGLHGQMEEHLEKRAK